MHLIIVNFCREVKTVAQQVEEESTEDWVDKLRKAQREKEIAEERVSCAYIMIIILICNLCIHVCHMGMPFF